MQLSDVTNYSFCKIAFYKKEKKKGSRKALDLSFVRLGLLKYDYEYFKIQKRLPTGSYENPQNSTRVPSAFGLLNHWFGFLKTSQWT